MFFVVRSNDSFNFPLGLIKYIVIVILLIAVIVAFLKRCTRYANTTNKGTKTGEREREREEKKLTKSVRAILMKACNTVH